MSLDAGSVMLASALATVAGVAVLIALGGRDRDELFRLGARFARDPEGALAVALMLNGVAGLAWGVVCAAVWSATGWPISALPGALMALVPWALRLRLRRSGRRQDAWASLASHLAYGATLGAFYRPGS